MLLLGSAGCARLGAPAAATTVPAADAEFERLADDFIDRYLAARPEQGTQLGFHQYDGHSTDYSRAALGAERVRLKKFERVLAHFPREALSPRQSYDFRILAAAVSRELFTFDSMKSFTENPMTYARALDVDIYIKRNFAPLDDRVRSIIALEEQAPRIFAAARENLSPTLAKPYVELAIEVAQGSADFLGKDLVEALRDLKNDALKKQFTAANDQAIQEIRHYIDWLKTERLPRAHKHYAIGRRRYEHMLRDGELIHYTPEKILEIGLQQLRREQQIFAAAAAKIDPARKPLDVFRDIQQDHPTAEGLIPDTKKNLEAIRRFIVERHIATFPTDVRVLVEETPPYARATSFASMDTPGPFETKATEAYYYVTPVEKEWPEKQKIEWLTAFNYYTTDVVSIHEAYPGHYLQNIAMNASGANKLEKIFGSYAFSEGWAHYCEQMMIDEGFPGDGDPVRAAKYRLAQSDEALLRLCRLCVSIKTHCHGMSVDEATKFFIDNCYYEAKPARSEAMRGTFDPGYLFYTLGKLEWLKLRRDYQAQEGANYSLQKFHDEILSHGSPPIRLLRELLLKDASKWDEIF